MDYQEWWIPISGASEKAESDRGLFGITEKEYGESYKEHLLRQYIHYVEMSDRLNGRRSTANAFFLTANTLIISGLGALAALTLGMGASNPLVPVVWASAGLLLCYAWRHIVESYKKLNTGKFEIILAIERKLPLSIYQAEWKVLGEGKDSKLYIPLTSVESKVPLIFIVLYLLLAMAHLVLIFMD